MKHLLKDFFGQLDLGIYPSLGIILFMAALVGITLFTYLPRNRKHYENASSLALDEGDKRG